MALIGFVCLCGWFFFSSFKEGERFRTRCRSSLSWSLGCQGDPHRRARQTQVAGCLYLWEPSPERAGLQARTGSPPDTSLASSSLGAKRRKGWELQNARPTSHPVSPPAFPSGDSGRWGWVWCVSPAWCSSQVSSLSLLTDSPFLEAGAVVTPTSHRQETGPVTCPESHTFQEEGQSLGVPAGVWTTGSRCPLGYESGTFHPAGWET